MEIYAKLWPFRRQYMTATRASNPSLQETLDATAAETAEDARKQYKRLLAAQPEIAATALSPEQLRDHVHVKLKDLLAKYQKVITPTSPSINCATHVRCLPFQFIALSAVQVLSRPQKCAMACILP
jgi:hypothetical protein